MKILRPAIGLTAFFFVVCGFLFPLVITAIAQASFPHQANGSLVKVNGKTMGSELIGQAFSGPKYFHSRPSAVGYDANNSGGTNLGPTNPKLLDGVEGFDGIRQLAAAYRETNGVDADTVLPPDAVTRSASGLDPHISPRNAELQLPRVARERGISEDAVRRLIVAHTEQPFAGIFGDPCVNVLKLNLALDRESQ